MDIGLLLQQMDESPSAAERLIRADWLEEHGYRGEAAFYHWLIEQGLHPDRRIRFVTHSYSGVYELVGYYWYSPFSDISTLSTSVITSQALWNALMNSRSGPTVFWGVNAWPSAQEAVAALRQAWLTIHGTRS